MDDTVIKDNEVYWDMKWDTVRFPNKPAVETIFCKEQALARMIAEGVIFLNNYWWMEEWPKDAQEVVSLNVNCNDVFIWGCADGESLKYCDIQDLYDHWVKDPNWGSAVWCIKKRKMLPQKPVFDSIQKSGLWDLNTMNLESNPTWPSPEEQ